MRAFPATYGVVVEPAPDGRTILQVAADDLASLAAYASGLSYGFEVLDPPELRAELRRRALAIANRHTGPSSANGSGQPTNMSADRNESQ